MSRPRVVLLAEQLRRPAAGGIGTYVRGLVRGLATVPEDERPAVTLLAGRPHGGRGVPDPLARLALPVRSSILPGPLMTRAWDAGLVRAPGRFDVVHATSVSTLEPGRAALVVTVHDLLWRRVPEAYPPRGRAWHEAALRRALRRADRFVVPAAVVADDLARAGADPAAISVVPMGADHLPPPDEAGARSLLSRLGVSGPFLLSVGTLEPRKNQTRLIEAYDRIRRDLPGPWPLVLVGPSGWGTQVRSRPGVILAGEVAPAVLAALYGAARLLAYVPLLEGFGLPPVEAMTFGAPVVASPLPSTGGAALEVDPEDVGSIAAGLLRVAVDEDERLRLRAAGARRASELTWAEITRRHVAVWEAAAARESAGPAGGAGTGGRGRRG